MPAVDLSTIQQIAMVVNSIGLPATIGVIAIIAAWNLLPVVARYLEVKIEVNKATTNAITTSSVFNTAQKAVSIETNKTAPPKV